MQMDINRVATLMQMRAIAIQFLKSLEDEAVAVGAITHDDRACLTRQERRQMRVIVTTSAAETVDTGL